MTSEYQIDLGWYRANNYFLAIRGTPSINSPTDFSVSVVYEDDTGENVTIARVDTSHGYVHFDRLYRRDEPKEEVDWSFDEAVYHLRENWRTYAESYEQK